MLSQMVSSTAEPAYVTNDEAQIVAWNDAVARLLGHSARGVMGKPCYSVLAGRDVFGNRFCDQNCPLRVMAGRGEKVHSLCLRVQSARGQPPVDTRVFPLFIPGDGAAGPFILHLLMEEKWKPVNLGSATQRRDEVPGDKAPHFTADTAGAGLHPSLTPRETEILRLLTEGLKTAEIAEQLCISGATVRNHVQSILRKLDVDTRLAAVAAALKYNLL